MPDYVLYRLPEKKEYHTVRGSAVELKNMSDLEDLKGFVLAPFNIGGDHSLLLIPAESTETGEVPQEKANAPLQWEEKDFRNEYHQDFESFHRYLVDETLDKIVLSRRLDMTTEKDVDVKKVFFKACRMYPHQMIALVSTWQSGTWLMATPEVLLRKTGDFWETMALAGTMKTPGPWSEKNKREHLIVSEYIFRCLYRFCYYMNNDSPHTVSAANLYHICTNFRFAFDNSHYKISTIINDLFPTPAVCGLPKGKAFDTIIKDESVDRKYYSGFCGPWNLDKETHLFVSLRCMEIDGNSCHLYAGGGLLKESVEETEWRETEAKLKTMKDVLG